MRSRTSDRPQFYDLDVAGFWPRSSSRSIEVVCGRRHVARWLARLSELVARSD
jgi:hypothetical protein